MALSDLMQTRRLQALAMDIGRRDPIPSQEVMGMNAYSHAVRIMREMQALGWRFTPPQVCPEDTNGDGDCGRVLCPHCGLEWERESIFR